MQELSPQGSFITAFGSSGSGPGQFLDGLNFGPKGVAVGPSGTIYVADTANKRVQEWVQAP